MTGHRVRAAAEADIPELVRLRALLFTDLAVTWGTAPAGGQWQAACASALADVLADGTMRIVVTDAPAGLGACGMGVIDRRLPAPWHPSGLIGHVFGVVTDPAHRRQGHARSVMEDLIGWFSRQGITRVDLNASPGGQQLYRSLGFTAHPDLALTRRQAPR